MKLLLPIAILLLLAWILIRVLFALTSAVFHLVWIIAVLCFLIWLVLKLKGR